MANKYTERKNTETKKPSGDDLLLQIMTNEYPNDAVYTQGTLGGETDGISVKPIGPSSKVLEELTRTPTGVLSVVPKYSHEMIGAKDGERMDGRIHAGAESGSEVLHDQYAKYEMKSSFPTVDEDELDEIIDEEWEYFEDPDEEEPIEIVERGESGIFLANRPFNLRDMHDLYMNLKHHLKEIQEII